MQLEEATVVEGGHEGDQVAAGIFSSSDEEGEGEADGEADEEEEDMGEVSEAYFSIMMMMMRARHNS